MQFQSYYFGICFMFLKHLLKIPNSGKKRNNDVKNHEHEPCRTSTSQKPCCDAYLIASIGGRHLQNKMKVILVPLAVENVLK